MMSFVVVTLLVITIISSIALAERLSFTATLKHIRLKVLPSVLMGLTIDQQIISSAFATPLGEHTGCAYPACTSKVEILQSTAPGLVPNEVKKSQIQVLQDTQIWLNSFPDMLQNKDYYSMRQALRSGPPGALRLTARKVRNYLEGEGLKRYVAAYEDMIYKVDFVDVIADRRMKDSSSDAELSKAISSALLSYDEFLKTLGQLIPQTAQAAQPAEEVDPALVTAAAATAIF